MIDTLRAHISNLSAWGGRSVNRRIFIATLTVGGLTLVVRSTGVVKEMVVARQFGAGDALDAFLIAFLLPTFAINVVAGSFSSAFIPTFIQVREKEGPEEAQRLLSGVTAWNIAVLAAVSALLALASPYVLPIVGSSFSPQKMALTSSLFFILLPCLVISGLSTLWGAVLNAGERFAMAALSPVMTPAFTVIALVLLGGAMGIYSLALGMLCGVVLEAVILAAGIRRQGFSIVPRWHGVTPPMKRVIRQYAPMVAGAFLMSGTLLVDQSMAAMLGPGSVSSFSYGTRLVGFVLGIGSMGLSTAVFPHFSHMVAVEDWGGVRHTLKTYARLILFITFPLTMGLLIFSEPIVRLVFERGAFTPADTRLVSSIQAYFLLQVPFYVLGILVVRLISSLKSNVILMKGAVINFCLNIVLNYILMKRLGVAGIALSTSIVYLVSLGYLSVMLNKQIRIWGTNSGNGRM